MKRINWILALITAGFLAAAPAMAQNNDDTEDPKDHGIHFVDANGDGYNDNAPDHDGDGIPNGLDPDYEKTGNGRSGQGTLGFVDADGDGINDNAPDLDGDGIANGMDPDFEKGTKQGRGFVDADGDGINDNLGNGRGGSGLGSGSGSGQGNGHGSGQGQGRAGQAGATVQTGDCDDMGPKGRQGDSKGQGRGK